MSSATSNRNENMEQEPDTMDTLLNSIKDHHHSVGSFLKFIEGAITDLRYTAYLNNRDVGRALDNITTAIQKARPVLDCQLVGGVGGRPGGDTYFGKELEALHKRVYEIETQRTVAREDLKNHRDVDRVFPLEDPDERRCRRRDLDWAQRNWLPEIAKQELRDASGKVMSAARAHLQLRSKHPLSLVRDPSADVPKAERHAAVRTALLENPDQPQSTFVKRYRVHPDTVQRTRRELEEAGAIPFLAHRHGPADHREASTQCERRDDIRGLADKTRRAKSPIETTTTAHHAETPATAGVRLSGEDEPSGDGAPISAVELARDNHWDGTNAVSERFAITHNR